MSDILVIGARGIPNMEGGAEKNAEMMFPLFVKGGYSVELLGIDEYINAPAFKGVKLKGLPTINFLKTDKVIYNFLALIYAIFTRPKIVHLQCLSAALFLSLYKLAGLKVVMRYGSADYELEKWGFVQRQALRLCEAQVRYADHVVTVSEEFKASLEDRYGLSRISVVPNGLDPVHVSDRAQDFYGELGLEGTRYILSVGRVTSQKDFETLVKAVRNLDDKSVKLIVAGGADGDYADKFFNNPDPRIQFIGRVDRDLLSALYQNCDVYVNSSLQEGLSNAVLEALSYSCPLILSDIPANREMALPDHNYFPTGSHDALRVGIARALDDRDHFRCATDRFSEWSDVFQRMLAVYAQVAPRSFARSPTSDTELGDAPVKVQAHEAKHV